MGDGSHGSKSHEGQGNAGPNHGRGEENGDEGKPGGHPREGDEENQGNIRVVGMNLRFLLVLKQPEIARSGDRYSIRGHGRSLPINAKGSDPFR